VNLAPRLKTYLGNHPPKWPDIVDAADWLRDELGISTFIWGDACMTMGREQAAIAVAIVSTKPPGHFRGSAGAYFHGMVSRAKSGELHLTRTIWGMRNHNERQHR
jgi:replication initiation protein RepC